MNRTVLLVVLLLVVIVGGGLAFIFMNPGILGGTPPEVTGEATRSQPIQQETRQPTPTDIPMVPVVMAIQDIPRGTVITPDRVSIFLLPAENAPQSALTTIETAVGKIAATDIYREEIILARKVVEDLNSLGSAGSEAAAILDPQRVAIAVPIDEITSVAYGLRPGDRIDVIVSMLFVDVDEDFQTLLPNDTRILTTQQSDELGNVTLAWGEVSYGEFSAESFNYLQVNEATDTQPATVQILPLQFSIVEEPNPLDGRRQRPRLVTQRTITDAQVIWVGEFPAEGSIFAPVVATPTQAVTPTAEGGAEGEATSAATPLPARPTLITLAVPVQDAVVLSWISEAGLPMTFVMRSARSQSLPDTNPVTMSYIMNAYNITVPPKFDYALEPAIRGVRGVTLLDTGQQRENVGVEPTAAATTEGQ